MRIKKGSLKYWVLLALEEAAKNGVFETFSYSSQMKYILNMSNLAPKTKRSYIVETIRRLRKEGLIEQEKHEEGKKLLKLTKLGRDFLGNNESWDGRYRIVIWDIPEKKRRVRNLLRRKLKDWGFINLQKSVWISERNVAPELRKLISDLELDKWVLVIESDDPSLSNKVLADRPR